MEDETPVKKPRKPDKRKTQERTAFQGFRKPESAFFRLPNEWTDITADITSLAELKIVEYVARHTWGFQEFEKYITLTVDEFMSGRKRNDETRMDKGTGLSESAAKLGITSAIEHGYIECEVDASDKGRISKSYRLKMVSSMDEVEGHNLTLEDQKVTSQDQKVTVREVKTNPRTDKIKGKDTNQRNLEKEDDTSLNITPEMEILNTFWCVSKHHRGSKSITAKHVEEYRDVAPKVHTQEEFDDLCEFALKELPPNNDGKLWMSNLANSVDNWVKEKQSQQAPEQQSTPEGSIASLQSLARQVCKHYNAKVVRYRGDIIDAYYQSGMNVPTFEQTLQAKQEEYQDIDSLIEHLRERFPVKEESVV